MASIIGVDVGQKRERTGICVVEGEYRKRNAESKKSEYHFVVRHLERLALGTPFPKSAHRIQEIFRSVEQRTGSPPTLYVDATGIGEPILELIRDAGVGQPVAVYFTHGDRRKEQGQEQVTLGKAYLVSRLQALLQTRRLHLPHTDAAQSLVKDLLNYEIELDEKANERYGAFSVGTQDDLVTALGLAVQEDPATYPSGPGAATSGRGRKYGILPGDLRFHFR